MLEGRQRIGQPDQARKYLRLRPRPQLWLRLRRGLRLQLRRGLRLQLRLRLIWPLVRYPVQTRGCRALAGRRSSCAIASQTSREECSPGAGGGGGLTPPTSFRQQLGGGGCR